MSSKEIIKYGIILFVITAVVGVALAGVNIVTKDKIAENTLIKEQQAYKEVIGGADDFTGKVDLTSLDNVNECIEEIIEAKENGEIAGYCVKLNQTGGYGGVISLVVGIDKNSQVTGISVIEHSETAGLGANLEKDSFKNQFKGIKEEITGVVKANPKESEIQAISGATITSKAVKNAVNSSLAAVRQINEGGDR